MHILCLQNKIISPSSIIGANLKSEKQNHSIQRKNIDIYKYYYELEEEDSILTTIGDGAFASTNLTEDDICSICQEPTRNKNLLCVVEDPKTVFSIEKIGTFQGYYHVLNGLISSFDGINPEDLKLETLGDMFNCNSAYLGKKFKKYTGVQFNTYLDNIRIDVAKENHDSAIQEENTSFNAFYPEFEKQMKDKKNGEKELASSKEQHQIILENIESEYKQTTDYFTAQINWLKERFPEGKYQDVIGLCKVAKLEGEDGIIDQDYSLNPGRYVGVVIEDDGMTEEEFKQTMLGLND